MGIQTQINDAIGHLIIDRPSKAHAYDRVHLDAFADALQHLESRCRIVVVRSTGHGAFCAGADLSEMSTADPLSALDLRSQKVFDQLARSGCVTIAVVHGAAVAGGCELALACDFRVVSPQAVFRLPETALGLIPAAGGTTRLTHLIGASRAKQIILLGEDITAQQALEWGLATRLATTPLEAALDMANALLRRDPTALRLAKSIIDMGASPNSLMSERVAEALLYSRKSDQ